MNDNVEVFQHCVLVMADSPETEKYLIEKYGLTGTNRIDVPMGFIFNGSFRTKESHDIYVIRLDGFDLDWLKRFGNSVSLQSLTNAVQEIYYRYFVMEDGGNPRNMAMWFDVIVIGTPTISCKLKHRGQFTELEEPQARQSDQS